MLQSLLDVFPSLRIGKMTGHLARFVVPVLVVFFTVTLFYTVVPMKNIPVRQAFKGALFTTLFLEIARHFFTTYIVATASHYGAVYGSLSTVVIFLLWVFYSACIFLIGAEVVRNLTSERGRRE
jgi:membrane protein